jgi:hypothetical protein
VLRFGVLSLFQVEDDGRPLTLGSACRRALLVLLTLNAGRVVGVERLVDALYGVAQPRTAVQLRYVCTSDLRRPLPDEVLDELATAGFVQVEARRLEERRLAARALRVMAGLARGDADLVPPDTAFSTSPARRAPSCRDARCRSLHRLRPAGCVASPT